jgi:hypothetical protein
MKRKKIIKAGIIVTVIGIVAAASIGLYMFNMPHRDVQKMEADYTFTSSQIVNEYLADASAANKIGETITVKGVIRSGASFDEDLELYENVILEKSDVVIR